MSERMKPGIGKFVPALGQMRLGLTNNTNLPLSRPMKRSLKGVKSRGYTTHFKSTRNQQGGAPIHPKMRKCPFCANIFADKEYETHIRGCRIRISSAGPKEPMTDPKVLWKGRFDGFDISAMPMNELRKKLRAANALIPKGSNLQHWLMAQIGSKTGRDFRIKIIDLVHSDWGF
jgi:hypothetical protein